MKLYLAGPMTGLPEFNYPEFRRIGGLLGDAGYEVLNPVDVDEQHLKDLIEAREACAYCDSETGKHPWQWYMLRTLAMTAEAEGLATMPGWQRSRGAQIEVAFACGMEIPVADWALWIDRKKTMQAGDWGR